MYILLSLCFFSFFQSTLRNSPMLIHIAKIHSLLLLLVFHCITIPGFTYPLSCWWIFVAFLGFVIINDADVKYSCTCLWVPTCKSCCKVISSLYARVVFFSITQTIWAQILNFVTCIFCKLPPSFSKFWT